MYNLNGYVLLCVAYTTEWDMLVHYLWEGGTPIYSQLSPSGHPAIADTRCYGQNPDFRERGLTGNDSGYYGLLLKRTLNNTQRCPL